MERRIDTEHNSFMTNCFIGVFDLAAHRHAGDFQEEVVEFFRHGDAGVDIDAMAMPHVNHDDGNVAMAFRQQADLPRERERRMAQWMKTGLR